MHFVTYICFLFCLVIMWTWQAPRHLTASTCTGLQCERWPALPAPTWGGGLTQARPGPRVQGSFWWVCWWWLVSKTELHCSCSTLPLLAELCLTSLSMCSLTYFHSVRVRWAEPTTFSHKESFRQLKITNQIKINIFEFFGFHSFCLGHFLLGNDEALKH